MSRNFCTIWFCWAEMIFASPIHSLYWITRNGLWMKYFQDCCCCNQRKGCCRCNGRKEGRTFVQVPTIKVSLRCLCVFRFSYKLYQFYSIIYNSFNTDHGPLITWHNTHNTALTTDCSHSQMLWCQTLYNNVSRNSFVHQSICINFYTTGFASSFAFQFLSFKVLISCIFYVRC